MKKTLVSSALGLTLLLGAFAGPVAAKRGPFRVGGQYVQTHWNLHYQVQDLNGSCNRLEGIVSQLGGRIHNLSSDTRNGGASINIRIPEVRMNELVSQLSSLGTLSQQNRSVSDNTSSYMESRRQLEGAEKLARTHIAPVAGMSESDRALAEVEFHAYVRDKIQSARNNLASYEQNAGWAEVSLNLQGLGRSPEEQPQAVPRRMPPQALPPAPTPTVQGPTPAAPRHEDWKSLAGAALVMSGGLLFLARPRRS